MTTRKRIVIGASGASGTVLLVRCVEELAARDDWEIHLVMTEGARLTASYEMPSGIEQVERLADVLYDVDDVAAPLASGTFRAEGMIVVPCSMKTLAGIHSGYADNLLLRAADVCMKEQRPLVLAARETPLSAVHLRNMHELSLVPGVHIVPPMMAFYHQPKDVDDMVRFAVAKLLTPFGIAVEGGPEWKGASC